MLIFSFDLKQVEGTKNFLSSSFLWKNIRDIEVLLGIKLLRNKLRWNNSYAISLYWGISQEIQSWKLYPGINSICPIDQEHRKTNVTIVICQSDMLFNVCQDMYLTWYSIYSWKIK